MTFKTIHTAAALADIDPWYVADESVFVIPA